MNEPLNISNERGLSLVELLVVLALTGILSIIIWRFFFQATELNNREVTQSTLQQEANLIVNTLHQTHTKEEIQAIYTDSENTRLIIDSKGNNPIIFNKSNVIYEIIPSKLEINEKGGWPSSFSLYIRLASSKHEDISYTTGSKFSKIKGSKQMEGAQ